MRSLRIVFILATLLVVPLVWNACDDDSMGNMSYSTKDPTLSINSSFIFENCEELPVCGWDNPMIMAPVVQCGAEEICLRLNCSNARCINAEEACNKRCGAGSECSIGESYPVQLFCTEQN